MLWGRVVVFQYGAVPLQGFPECHLNCSEVAWCWWMPGRERVGGERERGFECLREVMYRERGPRWLKLSPTMLSTQGDPRVAYVHFV